MTSIDTKLEVCKKTRKIAAATLVISLDHLLKSGQPISEVNLRDKWLEQMRKNSNIFPDGWYDPPPHGVVVLFTSKDNPERADFVNLRPEQFWPKEDIFLDKDEGFAYLFASPTNRETGLAGDFAVNIYFGNDLKIKNHLKKSLEIDKQIFEFIKIGMTFSEIFQFADSLIKKSGLRNNIVSVTDPDGVNIGHTIPSAYEGWSSEELESLNNAEKNWNKFKDNLSKKRRFLSMREHQKIQPKMVFTIEPALKITSQEMVPMTMFHHTVLIQENGQKELITYFDEIFRLIGMNYMLE